MFSGEQRVFTISEKRKVKKYYSSLDKLYDLGNKKRDTLRRQYLGQISTEFKKLHEVWNHKRIFYNLRLCATL